MNFDSTIQKITDELGGDTNKEKVNFDGQFEYIGDGVTEEDKLASEEQHESPWRILTSATRIVFILFALAVVGGFFMNLIPIEDFMDIAIIPILFYYSEKSAKYAMQGAGK